ncbi:Piso0_002619 [Millerozyma farinosa CBS 7064]|uniref:Piso0_002619 protein n=1 Tax=Pichia sorbitophila (strain ATCC MYA-4447 / BCRC 22081 / CBS 7064 / NBRC 10061 / NRRL Y-12695) TaxID=559304 RepID=G8YD36_PICSO|nr:Piso0_002619 [Millerozyma farinosa CBS 7064]
MIECRGITSKNTKCRRKVLEHQTYCYQHIHQGAQEKKPTQNKRNGGKAGYIYIFTLRKLIAEKGPSTWFSVKNMPDTKSRDKNMWVPFEARKSKYLLVKVGMTTLNVDRRIKQWEEKCHHELACVHPGSNLKVKGSSVDRLLMQFKELMLSERKFSTYNAAQRGFFCSSDVSKAEKDIHATLKRIYGRGDVYCSGCRDADQGSKAQSRALCKRAPFDGAYNIHIEWFSIPKKDLTKLYKIIDDTCSGP